MAHAIIKTTGQRITVDAVIFHDGAWHLSDGKDWYLMEDVEPIGEPFAEDNYVHWPIKELPRVTIVRRKE